MIEYAELEKRLRDYSATRKGEIAELTREAADAIEELETIVESYRNRMRYVPEPPKEEHE